MMSEATSAEVAALLEQLSSADAERRAEAAERLTRAGEAAAVGAAKIVGACGDGDERVREWAVAALEDLGAPPSESIAPLIKLVGASDPLVAYWATTLLGRSGQDAADAVAALTVCLDSAADLSVRQRAAWALGQIGPAAKTARAALERAEGQGDERLARLATEALGAIAS
jgi:HEAT repeat protein